jgi:hypothetical protein
MAYALVQSRSVQATSATAVALAFTGNVVAGNLIVASGVVFNTTYGTGGGSDTQGNTYTRDTFATATTAPQHVAIFSAQVGSSAACTVTLTTAGTGNPGIAIHEFSGLATSSVVDQVKSAGSASTGTTHATGNSPATTNANDLVFLTDGHSAGGVSTPTATGYTTAQLITATASIPIYTGHKRVTATGAQSGSVSWQFADWAVALVAYKESGGAATTSVPVRRRSQQSMMVR